MRGAKLFFTLPVVGFNFLAIAMYKKQTFPGLKMVVQILHLMKKNILKVLSRFIDRKRRGEVLGFIGFSA